MRPTSVPTTADIQFNKEVDVYVNLVLEGFPATEKQLKRIQEAQTDDAYAAKCTSIVKRDGQTRIFYQVLSSLNFSLQMIWMFRKSPQSL